MESKDGSNGVVQKKMGQQNKRKNSISDLWLKIIQAGLGERLLKIGSAVVTVLLIGTVLWVTGNFFMEDTQTDAINLQETLRSTPVRQSAVLPYYDPAYPKGELKPLNEGVFRSTKNDTELPAKARTDVIKYVVQKGDTVTSIAEKFNLRPSTILWANPYTLADNPHLVVEGMELNILPVDGVYYDWHDGDGLNGVAEVYGVTPEDIINYPGNGLDPATIGDYSHPNIAPGTSFAGSQPVTATSLSVSTAWAWASPLPIQVASTGRSLLSAEMISTNIRGSFWGATRPTVTTRAQPITSGEAASAPTSRASMTPP